MKPMKHAVWFALLFFAACAAKDTGPMAQCAKDLPIFESSAEVGRPFTPIGGTIGLVPEGMGDTWLRGEAAKKACRHGADAIVVRKAETIDPDPGLPIGAPEDGAERAFDVIPDRFGGQVRIEAEFIKFQ